MIDARAWPALAFLLFLLPALHASAQEGTGEVRVFVFGADGRPRAGAALRCGDSSGVSDEAGVVRLRVAPGTHRLSVGFAGRDLGGVEVRVLGGAVTEAVIRLDQAAGTAQAEVENAGLDARAAPGKGVPPAAKAPGMLSGLVKDGKDGRPVAGVRIFVRGLPDEARTGADGRFSLKLAAGARVLSVIHPEYAARTAGPVEVPENGAAAIDIELSPSAVELPGETVRGYRIEGGLVSLLAERKQESVVAEIIGRDQITKSGDSDAASALRRVTGLTVVGGRYVYVRGMGERYSSTLLNGATLPSPQPERRAVPLDLFPVDVIESVSIRKTYTPDLPGEFGGGTVVLRTRSMPDKFRLGFSASLGWNSETTFRRGLTYAGGNTDWLGVDDGTRDLPPIVEAAGSQGPIIPEDPVTGEGWSAQSLEAFGEAFQNVWSAEDYKALPDGSLGAIVGDKIDLLGTQFGYQFGMLYDNQTRTRRSELRAYSLSSSGLGVNYDYDSLATTNTINVGAILNLAWQPAEKQEIAATSVLVRTTRKRAEVYQGDFVDGNAFIRVTELDWTEEMLWSNQLRGSHALFGGAEFGWRGNWSLATRDQPDFRRTRYDLDPVGNIFYLSSRPEGNQRLFNELDDEGLDLAADLKVPVPLGHGVEASVRGGAGWIHRSREAQTRRYKFQHVGPRASDPAVLSRPAEDIFTPENIGPDGFELQEITRATDAYEAEQELTSFFGMAELKLSNGLELVGGVRVESSRQEVRTFNIFSPGQEQVAELDTTDPLPAVNAAWRFMEGWQVRTGYSRTLSRPDFRELSEAPYDQVIGGGVVVGNPELQRATIDNYDVRLEWYPSEAESVSVGLFYKGLDQPIETVLVGGSNRTTTYENAESAKVFGLELEFRKGLGFASDLLRNWSFSGNLALIGSKVEISNPGIATEDQRPLQGQSPYVLNLAFGYDDPEAGLSAALLYNVSGPRISEIGVSGLPDVYEQPFHQLDFVASWTINANFSVKLKVRNLLDGMQEFTQEGEPTLSYRKGMDVTLGVSWSY